MTTANKRDIANSIQGKQEKSIFAIAKDIFKLRLLATCYDFN